MLQNKRIVVTGASSGIGLAITKSLIEAGANVLVAGSYIFGNKDYMAAIKKLKE